MSVFHGYLLKSLQLHWTYTFYYTDKRHHPVYTFWNVIPFQTWIKKISKMLKLYNRNYQSAQCSLLCFQVLSHLKTQKKWLHIYQTVYELKAERIQLSGSSFCSPGWLSSWFSPPSAEVTGLCLPSDSFLFRFIIMQVCTQTSVYRDQKSISDALDL